MDKIYVVVELNNHGDPSTIDELAKALKDAKIESKVSAYWTDLDRIDGKDMHWVRSVIPPEEWTIRRW